MPHINQLKESRFLKKEDVGNGHLAKIQSVDQVNVAKEGAPEELRWCVFFENMDKPLVLNSTNAQLIAVIAKSEETDLWPGTSVVLYNDPAISYAGKITGGIRVRAPKGQAAQVNNRKPAPAPAPAPAVAQAAPQRVIEQEMDDPDVPF